MKLLKLCTLILVVTLTSCSTVKVTTDYDTKVDFNSYKTFAFHKKGIDKATISDLDKKRVMRAIESEMVAKGFTKSNDPDILISIFNKTRERVTVNNNRFGMGMGWGWGWGWNPWMMGGMSQAIVNQHTEGTLFIDFIDRRKNELIWQGIGSGAMKFSNVERKEKRIKEFVKEIIERYPPGSSK